jgi:peptidoglycan/xylan/chitin deacetylase (PgdA/CDA1 family)
VVRSVGVPILTYHAMNVSGDSYESNDHVALAQDLEALTRRGIRVVPLLDVVTALEGGNLESLRNCAALTFDDGSDFDFRDLPHPKWGIQRSMLNILRDAKAGGGQPTLEATSFVIASPEARAELDRTCMVGKGWWNDDWWRAAEATGLMRIESHSWDHNHDTLRKTVADAPTGTFHLQTRREADEEIARASEFVIEKRGRAGGVLFAYPYGEYSDFLAREYFPHEATHRVRAAFTTEPAPVNAGCDPWRIPRFVFGAHWRTPGDFERLLDNGWRRDLHRFPLALREVATLDDDVADLFRRSFGSDPPDFPRHFVARDPDGQVVGYVHFTQQEPEVFLVGGLCVDFRAYRRMSNGERDVVALEGSISRWILSESIAALGSKRAVFAYTGNTMSRRDVLALGFVPASGRYLLVQWHGEPAGERPPLVSRITAAGAF